jgi:hypothetical protein
VLERLIAAWPWLVAGLCTGVFAGFGDASQGALFRSGVARSAAVLGQLAVVVVSLVVQDWLTAIAVGVLTIAGSGAGRRVFFSLHEGYAGFKVLRPESVKNAAFRVWYHRVVRHAAKPLTIEDLVGPDERAMSDTTFIASLWDNEALRATYIRFGFARDDIALVLRCFYSHGFPIAGGITLCSPGLFEQFAVDRGALGPDPQSSGSAHDVFVAAIARTGFVDDYYS